MSHLREFKLTKPAKQITTVSQICLLTASLQPLILPHFIPCCFGRVLGQPYWSHLSKYMHAKRSTSAGQAKLSQNSKLPLEPVNDLSSKVFRKMLNSHSILLASYLGDLSKYK